MFFFLERCISILLNYVRGDFPLFQKQTNTDATLTSMWMGNSFHAGFLTSRIRSEYELSHLEFLET